MKMDELFILHDQRGGYHSRYIFKVGDALGIHTGKLLVGLEKLAEFIDPFIDIDSLSTSQMQPACVVILNGIHDRILGYMGEDGVDMYRHRDDMSGDVLVPQRQKSWERIRDIRFPGMDNIVRKIGNLRVIDLVRVQDQRGVIAHLVQMLDDKFHNAGLGAHVHEDQVVLQRICEKVHLFTVGVHVQNVRRAGTLVGLPREQPLEMLAVCHVIITYCYMHSLYTPLLIRIFQPRSFDMHVVTRFTKVFIKKRDGLLLLL